MNYSNLCKGTIEIEISIYHSISKLLYYRKQRYKTVSSIMQALLYKPKVCMCVEVGMVLGGASIIFAPRLHQKLKCKT